MNSLPSVATTTPWESLLLLGFYVLTLVYLIFTIILYYHWQQYSINRAVSITTAWLYLGTTLPLIAIMGISVSLL